MEEQDNAEVAQAAAQLILVEGLMRSVSAKAKRVHGELVEIRRHLEEVARLSEGILTQVRSPNPVRTDAEAIRADTGSLLALPSLAFLDF